MRIALIILVLLANVAIIQAASERTYHCANCQSTQGVQEIATAVRSILEIRDLTVTAEDRRIRMAAPDADLVAAEWAMRHLDLPPANPQSPADASLDYALSANDHIRVYFAPATPSVQDFQEMATLMRTVGEIRRLFTYNSPKAIILRGNPEQLAVAEWIYRELTRPANQPQAPELRLENGEVVQVFYLPKTPSVAVFQQDATQVRQAIGIRRLFTYNRPRAIVVCDTPEKVAEAARLFAKF